MSQYKYKHKADGWKVVSTRHPEQWARKKFVAQMGGKLERPLKDKERLNPATGEIEPIPPTPEEQERQTDRKTMEALSQNLIDNGGLSNAELKQAVELFVKHYRRL